jgi:hypothetical protein
VPPCLKNKTPRKQKSQAQTKTAQKKLKWKLADTGTCHEGGVKKAEIGTQAAGVISKQQIDVRWELRTQKRNGRETHILEMRADCVEPERRHISESLLPCYWNWKNDQTTHDKLTVLDIFQATSSQTSRKILKTKLQRLTRERGPLSAFMC